MNKFQCILHGQISEMIDCIEQQQRNLQNPALHLNQYHRQTNLTHHQHQIMHQNHHQQAPAQQNLNERQPNNNQILTMYQQQLANNPTSLVELPSQANTVAATITTSASNNNNNNNSQTHQQSGNELIGYYFGSISRETAEWILKSHGNQTDGAYLLRSSGPNDDFVLSLMVVRNTQPSINQQAFINNSTFNAVATSQTTSLEVLHYKIVETEDSFVALHGQVGDEKFATIDELIDKAQGVATKPRWPIFRQLLESQILPPTYWGLTVDQIRLAILLKAKQWGFPLLSSLFQQAPPQEQLIQNNLLLSIDHHHHQQQQQNFTCNQTGNMTEKSQINNNITTLNNETIRTLIYKSLHEFQPWFHGKISREEAERRIEDGSPKDGKFLVRERDNYSYAMCISHKKTTKHYRIDVLPTGELAIQDGRKFTSLMALVSHYTIMSDGLWCALTEACPRPIQTPYCIQRNLTNGCSSAALKSTLLPPNAQVARNNCNMTMNQNVYCIPPPCNNINNNSAISNNIHNIASAMPIIKSLPDNNTTNNNNIRNDLQLNQNNSTVTHSNGKTLQTHNLICTPQQAGIVSIKAPIKEWLQTINHKWSQLIASKNQHQSLNSFLFGNQNPLNNHCRHNHRNQHHMSHRRKCKNGHTSCGCIQQIIANGRTPTAALNRGVAFSGIGVDSNEIQQFATKLRSHDHSGVRSCCTSTSCPTANKDRLNLLIPTNILPNGVSTDPDHSNNALLSCLPQNSGFTLNSQSFIGSPLFAVKQQAQLERNHTGNYSGSSNSGSGNSNSVGEEKLISPAQSISADLNNPYNLNNDIYGSQTSTAVVNDRIQTSSSSSSGTVNMLQKNSNNTVKSGILQKRALRTIKPTTNNDEEIELQRNVTVHQTHMTKQAGPILCGQHAGPAYRYTNCNDENSFKPCYHRPMASYRAADDSLLPTPSTQLANSAAMAKFVQFQDGQCLRTHRDIKSIQMAYLSSRQDPNNNNINTRNTLNPKSMGCSNQVPLRELNILQQQQLHQQNNFKSNLDYILKNEKVNHNGQNNMAYPNGTPSSTIQASGLPQTGNSLSQQNHSTNAPGRNVQENAFKDIDLMDCGEHDDDYDFKYDPKLIKSSSIETLCGAGDDSNMDNELAKCKNNAELMVSLQSCWFSNQQPDTNLLNPIPSTQYSPSNNGFVGSESHTGKQQDQTTMLSNLMDETGQTDKELIHMKKKHDLDELTTALLAELTASLKAQVDLKNKRSGFGLHNAEKQPDQLNHNLQNSESGHDGDSTNPLELLHEFDTLVPNNK